MPFSTARVSHLALILLKYIMDNFSSDTLHPLREEQPLNLPQQDQRAKGGEFRRFHESLISPL